MFVPSSQISVIRLVHYYETYLECQTKKDEYPFRPFIEGANSTPLH